MPNIGNDQLAIGIKKFMVFDVSGNIKISPAMDGCRDQKTARTTSNSHLFYHFAFQWGMTNNTKIENFGK